MSTPPDATPPLAGLLPFNSAIELARTLGVELKPPPKPGAVRRQRKALPGYAAVLDDTAELLRHDAEALAFHDIDPGALIEMQQRYQRLRATEAMLEAVYLSVYYERLQLDDEAMGLLQRIVRRVRSRLEEAPAMRLRWSVLLDFMGAFRKGGRPKGSTKVGGAASNDSGG